MTTVMNIEPFDQRLEAFGARVYRVNGHDVAALTELGQLESDGRPIFILCDTDPCRGIPLLEKRVPKLHYVRFSSEEEKKAYQLAFEQLFKEEKP